eukprot:362716-Chlamydomonas_euryale.AAC.12
MPYVFLTPLPLEGVCWFSYGSTSGVLLNTCCSRQYAWLFVTAGQKHQARPVTSNQQGGPSTCKRARQLRPHHARQPSHEPDPQPPPLSPKPSHEPDPQSFPLPPQPIPQPVSHPACKPVFLILLASLFFSSCWQACFSHPARKPAVVPVRDAAARSLASLLFSPLLRQHLCLLLERWVLHMRTSARRPL